MTGLPLARLAALRRILLALIAPGEGPEGLAELPAAQWQMLDALAAQHRLQPLLHARRGDCALVPEDLRAGWHRAYRAAALDALHHKGELARTIALLRTGGFAPLALKGAWLAWHAYPDPALRPLRDLDLLLDPASVISAWELLAAQGYVPDAADLPLEDAVRLDKHLPPLVSPRGVVVELHQRLGEAPGRTDHAAPRLDPAKVRANAIDVDGVTFPAPPDMLAHLIVHAVYDHRLDCGPLLLTDMAALLGVAPIDWPAFWGTATAGGWRDGARLVLELVARHDPTLPIAFDQGPTVPAALGAAAPDLLLQDLATRQSAGVVATFAAAGPAALLRRLGARRSDPEGQGSVARDLGHAGGFLGWAGSRARRTLGELVQPAVRQQSRELAALSRWLGRNG